MLVADSTLWGDSVLVEDFDSGMHTDGARINAEVGYGLAIWEDLGLLKPYGGVLLSEMQENKYRVGTKLDLDTGIGLELKGSHTLEEEGSNEDEIKLEGSIKW